MTEVTSNDILPVSAGTSCTLLVKLLVDPITNARKYPNEYFITFSIDDAQVLLYNNWSIVADGFDESMGRTFLQSLDFERLKLPAGLRYLVWSSTGPIYSLLRFDFKKLCWLIWYKWRSIAQPIVELELGCPKLLHDENVWALKSPKRFSKWPKKKPKNFSKKTRSGPPNF